MKRKLIALIICVFCANAIAADFVPDPASVQREGPAYRYPQAGWIVLHIEGDPYTRGFQHGKLMAPEIADYVRAYATMLSPKAPADGWKLTRRLVDAVFTRRFDPELLEEMKGIADGAAKAGATFDGRPIDLTDIVAINAWAEIDSLDDALQVTPTGLNRDRGEKSSASKPSRCSAFVATGPATKDGKPIIGHITMFDLYPCNFYNVWIDIKPTKGHRLILQGAPGSVQSGMDWYQNDAGMVMVETTIDQTKFNAQGMSIGSRSRLAMQYGDSIDSVVEILSRNGNGLYTNEWLMADMHSNEIAMFELGTKASKVYRSSRGEWFGNTEGFYWGCNNTKSQEVKLESIASTTGRPADATFCPTDRDVAWVKLYQQYKGKIDADFGKVAYSKPPLVSRHSCDAKYATADLALQMKANAIFGDPYGQLWEPSAEAREKFPEIKPIVPGSWTVLGIDAPSKAESSVAADVPPQMKGETASADDDDSAPQAALAWHGTILPATDGDIWLASAFAKFQSYASQVNQAQTQAGEGAPLSPEVNDALAGFMFDSRADALACPTAPRSLKFDPADDLPMRGAVGRGVLMLSELRRKLGSEKFDHAMDDFGLAHAGKKASTDEFMSAMQLAGNEQLKGFFHYWLETADALPTLTLTGVGLSDGNQIVGEVSCKSEIAPKNIEVTIEMDDGEFTQQVALNAPFKINSEKSPRRVVVNKYGSTAIANAPARAIGAYMRDLESTIIVYGTREDGVANLIAAEALQKALIGRWEHTKLAIVADASVSESDLREKNLLLIGAPASNSIVAKFADAFPVKFGPHSFVAGGLTYANMDSAMIAAAENPAGRSRTIVCVMGLSPGAIYRAAQNAAGWINAPLRVLPARRDTLDIVPPAPELVHEFHE